MQNSKNKCHPGWRTKTYRELLLLWPGPALYTIYALLSSLFPCLQEAFLIFFTFPYFYFWPGSKKTRTSKNYFSHIHETVWPSANTAALEGLTQICVVN